MPIRVPLSFAGIDEGTGSDGTRNGSPPRGMKLFEIARGTDHAAARGRVLFSTAIRAADSADTDAATNTWAFRWSARNNNGKNWGLLALAVPKRDALNANTMKLRISVDGAATVTILERVARDTAILIPDDVMALEGSYTPAAPDGALHTVQVSTIDGFRCLALCIFERANSTWPRAPAMLDETRAPPDFVVQPRAFLPGRFVVTDGAGTSIVDLRQTQEEVFHNMRTSRAWSVPQSTGRSVNSTTFTNIVDGTFAGRTPSTWGIPVHSIRGGYGLRTQVEASLSVRAEATGGLTGEVQFISSLGDVTIGSIGALGWYDGGAKIALDTNGGIDGGRDWDKVDVLARLTTGPGVDNCIVYQIRLDVNPD